MARAIDAEKYMDLLKEQYSHHEAMGNKQMAKAWQGAMQLLYDMPTLTPPNEWVSVKERRPQAGHDVIALLPCGDCAVVWWTGSVWRVRWDATQLDREPTHWMPLPAPPDRRPPEGEDGDANHA